MPREETQHDPTVRSLMPVSGRLMVDVGGARVWHSRDERIHLPTPRDRTH